jgi:hypothetical protein
MLVKDEYVKRCPSQGISKRKTHIHNWVSVEKCYRHEKKNWVLIQALI